MMSTSVGRSEQVGPSMLRRCGAAFLAAAVIASSCSSDPTGDAEPLPGVVLQVLPDLSDEPDDVRFAAVPELLVTEDGRVIYGAPAAAAIQGELLEDVWVQTITPAGVDAVVDAVEDGDGPSDIDELITLVGGELGDPSYYLPDAYRFAAVALGPLDGFDDPDTPVVQWPATASVGLADADSCTTLPELEVGEAFETAAADSAFVDDDIVYGVLAAPDWPGAPCALPD